MFYNQKLKAFTNDLGAAHRNEDKTIQASNTVRRELNFENQEHLEQAKFIDQALEASTNKCEELRQAVEVQNYVITKLSSSRTDTTEAWQLAQAQSEEVAENWHRVRGPSQGPLNQGN